MLQASRVKTSKIHRVTAVAYGVICHTLFAVGVGTMIAAMFFGMSRSFGRVPSPWRRLPMCFCWRNFLSSIRCC
jgi:hypothetical protein